MGQLVSLEGRKPAAAGAGCAAKACGPAAPQAELPAEVQAKVQDHPCYSEDAHQYFARMHVAVAPACNIQCHYCNRKYDCANESRPGVVSEKLTPEQAVRKVVAVANEVPELSVLGVAGPGDACHDWPRTRATLEAVRRAVPGLKLCLSTNGLALPDCVDDIAALGIDHVTITINMVNPEVGTRIHPWVWFRGTRYRGLEAATLLRDRQQEGLERLVEKGVLVKVNSVLIPGVNDVHLLEVNRVVMGKGAFLHNVMPLLSDPAHGTHFGLTGQRGPTPRELQGLQDRLGQGSRLMRHCRQCRADAVGLLGEDRGQAFALDRLPAEAPFDPTLREAHREVVARERSEHAETRKEAVARLRALEGAPPLLVAVASRGGGRINQHFGHATEFQVYEASPAGVRLVGHRKADPSCQGGWAEDASLDATLALLAGVRAVLCAKVGSCPREALEAAGVAVSDRHAYEWIEAGVAAWYAAEVGQGAGERSA